MKGYLGFVGESHDVFEEVVFLVWFLGEGFAEVTADHVDGSVSVGTGQGFAHHVGDCAGGHGVVGFGEMIWSFRV